MAEAVSLRTSSAAHASHPNTADCSGPICHCNNSKQRLVLSEEAQHEYLDLDILSQVTSPIHTDSSPNLVVEPALAQSLP